MIGRLGAIPLMLVSLAASAEDGQITLKNLLGDDLPPVTTQNFGSPCSSAATGNAACGSSANFPLGGSGDRAASITMSDTARGAHSPCDGTPNCQNTFMTIFGEIATLGAGGCIIGPFKLFYPAGHAVLEIPANAEYPVGCRERK